VFLELIEVSRDSSRIDRGLGGISSEGGVSRSFVCAFVCAFLAFPTPAAVGASSFAAGVAVAVTFACNSPGCCGGMLMAGMVEDMLELLL